MNTDFARSYLGDFTLPESETRLQALAEDYCRETEAYDLTVCSGPLGRDGILPDNHQELALINRHAQQVFDRLCDIHAGTFTREQTRHAIARFECIGGVR
ncbi:hypothetical protein ACIQVE_23225 [Pseudomonas sp. NPDC098747]|uniref:hypothetical protein n=1 Tax=Pseudomonas sp. NPDC098747 TaxID=3364487 RepID=UPI00383A0796